MSNVFRKLMRHELGAGAYERYSAYIHEQIEKQTVEDKRVYDEMWKQLSTLDVRALNLKKNRLEQTILKVFFIRKQFGMKLLALFVLFLAVLLLQPVQPVFYALVFAVACMTIRHITEYAAHRYCYVDARMILIYKAVLEYLCSPREKKHTL